MLLHRQKPVYLNGTRFSSKSEDRSEQIENIFAKGVGRYGRQKARLSL